MLNLPSWFGQGTNQAPTNGGFGSAAMFNAPDPATQGVSPLELLRNTKLANLLMQAVAGTHPMPQNQSPNMAQTDNNTSYTPFQSPAMGPNMGQVNPYAQSATSPNGQPMPNWNPIQNG